MQPKHITLTPRISEKTYALSRQNTYAFVVPKNINKSEIAAAVTVQYNVKVADVHVIITKGKVKQTVRKGGRPSKGRRTDVKKAYVTLVEGESIKMFDEEEQK